MKPFAYADYERALRDRALIVDLQRRFVPRFVGTGPVLDLGCGQGIFLDLLRDAGIDAVGVDRDPDLVREARAAGHEAIEADIFSFLAGNERRFGGAFCSHLVEHLPFAEVLTLIEGIARCLRPGGVFVAVFPNPESARMQLSGFWKDPEHVRFYHADLIGAVCAHYGLAAIGGSAEEPAPNRLEPPWLAGAHLDGLRIAAAEPPPAAPAAGDPSASPVPREGGSGSGAFSGADGSATANRGGAPDGTRRADGVQAHAGRAVARSSAHWVNERLDAISPRAHHFLGLLAALRTELRTVIDDEVEQRGRIAAELHAARTAIDGIVGMQERLLAGLATLNANIERFNAEMTSGLESFNRRLGPLVDALNAMWSAPDEAVLVCRKTAELPRGGAAA